MLRPRAASSRHRSAVVVLRAQACFALIVTALSWVAEARAATVAILRPSHDSREIREALFRLKGELLAVGLDVVLEQRGRTPGDTASPAARQWLEQLASEQALDALLDVVGDAKPTRVDVWLRDDETRRLAVTRVEPERDADNPAESLAIHAIEVLRSRFLPIDAAPAPRPLPSPPPPDRVAPREAPARRRLGLELGATALTGFGGVGPSVLPLLRLNVGLDHRLALQATVAGFGTRGSVEAGADRAFVAQQFGLLGACWCPELGSFEPMVSLAAGFLRTAVEGQATAPNLAHRDRSGSFLIEASAGLRLSFASRYFLTVGGQLQLAQPYVAIHVLESVVATSGSPNLLFTLTLGAWR